MARPSISAVLLLFICLNNVILAIPNSKKIHHLAKRSDSESSSNYRSFDGSYNNLENSNAGTPLSKYNRLLAPNYADGYKTSTVAVSGKALSSSRSVSLSIYRNHDLSSFLWSFYAYAQFIALDLSTTLGRSDEGCCTADGQIPTSCSDYCYPISVGSDDPDYCNITCLPYSRSVTDEDLGCLGNRSQVEQIDSVNHYLDLSHCYGNTEEVSKQLRSFCDGKLKSDIKDGEEFLPSISINATSVDYDGEYYLVGDSRVNSSPLLVILQTLLLREHNRIAVKLAELNPHWDDERLFQEARKINIAQHQYISYYEFLSLWIGEEHAYENKILYCTDGHVDDYDCNADVSVLNEFAQNAFELELFIKETLDSLPNLENKSTNIQKLIGDKSSLYKFITKIVVSWSVQSGYIVDQDWKSLGTQRNRDHGLASYNDYRQLSGLPKAANFCDFSDVISDENVRKLEALYECPDDVDLSVGCFLETKIKGAKVGPTLRYILTEQFYRTRVGDRYWFENSGETGFSVAQLKEIRKSSFARLLCDNSVHINTIQPHVFKPLSLKNLPVYCEYIASVDLSPWKDEDCGEITTYDPEE